MNAADAADAEDGQVGSGSNWIERAFPVDTGSRGDEASELRKAEDYNLGISGKSFQTGPLGLRMYNAIIKANGGEEAISPEIRKAFTLYAMDFTAKEATRAALKQNGLDMAVEEDMEDEGMWGEIDSIQLLDMETEEPIGPLYETTEEAIDDWEPGQAFNFVVRQVPAKISELSLDELLQALDPKGELRAQAQEANWTLPDEDISSLRDLANDSLRRTNMAPRETNDEQNAFRGLDKRGYRVISRGELSRDSVNADGSENYRTLMHVMDALVSHQCLVVDLSDGGTTYKDAFKLADMWTTTENFFQTLDKDSSIQQLPGMMSVMDGNPHAKVGYASYDNGSMQFLETRFERKTGDLLPAESRPILGDNGIGALRNALQTICEVGKDVVRIATAASSVEAGAFDSMEEESNSPSISGLSFLDDDDDDDDDDGGSDDDDDSSAQIRASQAATLLVDELIDDGSLLETDEIEHTEGEISMTPHRFCRYSDNQLQTGEENNSPREVFGAHTDSSFITAVPVAAVSGLEVFDEAEERWYRPELAARLHWEREQDRRGKVPDALVETVAAVDDDEEDVDLPWHARYVVVMPGEFLQIVTRNEVPAAVHRVISTKDGPARLSAPVLLRGRPGTKLNVARYLGKTDTALLLECDGLTMDEIHAAMQPSSYQ